MKYIIQGIKDYYKDVHHDRLCRTVNQIKGCCVFEFHFVATMAEHDCDKCWRISQDWKEGSVWHYIRQRKIADKRKTNARHNNVL